MDSVKKLLSGVRKILFPLAIICFLLTSGLLILPSAPVQAAGGLSVLGTVPIPASPRLIAVNSLTHRAYVAVGDGFGDGTNSFPFYVSVIDGTTDIADIAVGAGDYSTGPTHIAVNEATNRVYVNHTGYNFANAINAGTNSVGNIGTGAYPEGIVTNPATNRLYIANTNSGNVWVINTAGDANTFVTSIGIPGAGASITNLYLAIIPATNRIFVSAPGLNKIFVIDGGSNTVVQTFTVAGNPFLIVANPTTNQLYAETGSTVSVVDVTTGTTVATVSLGSPLQGLAVNPTLNHIYATSSSVLTVIDGATNTVASSVDVGATAYSVGADASNGRVYVGTSAKKVVVLSDAAINTYTITASAGAGGTISPSGSVSANYGDNKTFTITPNTGYSTANLTVDGSAVTPASSYTFTNVTANHTIAASFATTNQPPFALFTYSPQSLQVNQTVTFDASASYDPDGTIVSYQWEFGDGSTGTGKIVEHAYAGAGQYGVILTVTDNSGVTGQSGTTLTVSQPSQPITTGRRSLPDPSTFAMVGSGLGAALLYIGLSRLRQRLNRS